MTTTLRTNSVRGFTMTELLVAVAIIGLLASLALPALSSARENASSTGCLANQRNAHRWLVMYAADHNGRFPAPLGPNLDTPNNPGNLSWWSVLQLYFESGVVPPSVGERNPARNPWYCRAAEKTFPKGVRRVLPINADGGASTVHFTPALNEKWAQTLLIADGVSNSGDPVDSWAYFRSSAQTPGIALDARHKGKINGIFLDGHAASFAPNDPQLETWIRNLRN